LGLFNLSGGSPGSIISIMVQSKVHIKEDQKLRDPESENPIESKIMVSERGVDIKIKENTDVIPAAFEMKEDGATYSVGSEMLKNLKKFFHWDLKRKKNPFPTLLLWYKGLSKEQKKSVMIISKERTENDSSPDRKMEE
jgi:hypothetical protein